jgi:hypothetical protein
MSRQFKPGDRVRLTQSYRVPGYHPGGPGTILDGPSESGAVRYYVVKMERPRHVRPLVFSEEQIEALA